MVASLTSSSASDARLEYLYDFLSLSHSQFDWCIWPPTQYVNFVYVPSKYRVSYVNAVTVVWDVFLSYMKHFDEHDKEGSCWRISAVFICIIDQINF